METLDCPSGDQITPTRTNSVTVQQALALWNDAFIANHCEHIAARVQADLTGDGANSVTAEHQTRKQVERMVALILGRPGTDQEINELSAYTSRHGLANTCRLLLNSNEFLFVN